MKAKKPFNGPATGRNSKVQGADGVRFNVDHKTEMRKMNIHKNHLNGKIFHLTEKMTGIFKQNIALQKKLDKIYVKGSGNYDQKNLKVSNYNKTPMGERKGSLNFTYQKQEALKIDRENIKMA